MNMQNGISGWLVRHAAASMAPSLAQRLEEEWLADLQTRRHHASRLLFALGCCWAAQTIAREFPAGAIAANAAGATATAVAFSPHGPHRWSQRPGAMFVIVAFHLVVIYAFAMVFNTPPRKIEPPAIKGGILTTPEPTRPPLPRPKVQLAETQFVAPLVHDHFSFPQESTSITFTEPPNATGSGPRTDIIRVPGGPGAGFPTAEDHYPAAAKRLGEQGSTSVRVCVDASGRLTELPTVAQSAGSPRLDAGALQLAQAGSGHYRSAKENGRAVTSCFAFRVTFRLQ